MLTLECPYCHIPADKTELTPGYQAHLKRFGPDSTDEDFDSHMFARKNPTKHIVTAVLSAALFPRGWRVE